MIKQQWGYITRKFGGKRYRIGTWHKSKREAEVKAKRLRGMGYNVRIVKQQGQYVIYANPDPMKQ